jgi:hypothetical protein
MTVHALFPDMDKKVAPNAEAMAAFDKLWASWPRKDGKAVSRAKYLAIIKGGYQTKTLDKSSGQFIDMELGARPEQILAGAKAYVASQIDKRTYRLKDEGKFIPHLSTWLGRAGWEDWL